MLAILLLISSLSFLHRLLLLRLRSAVPALRSLLNLVKEPQLTALPALDRVVPVLLVLLSTSIASSLDFGLLQQAGVTGWNDHGFPLLVVLLQLPLFAEEAVEVWSLLLALPCSDATGIGVMDSLERILLLMLLVRVTAVCICKRLLRGLFHLWE